MTKVPATKTVQTTAQSDGVSLWSRFDTKRSVSSTTPPRPRRFRWVVDAVLPLALTFTVGIAVLLPTTLPTTARLALFVFISTVNSAERVARLLIVGQQLSL